VRSCICGRAELVKAFASGGPAMLADMAKLLGYEPVAKQGPSAPVIPFPPQIQPAPDEQPPLQHEPKTLLDVPFWRVETYEAREPERRESVVRVSEEKSVDLIDWRGRPATHPITQALEPWRSLLPRLRHVVARPSEGPAVDIGVITDRLSQGHNIDQLPRVRQRRWGDHIQVIVDRSERLVPYWADQDLVCAALKKLYPRHAFELAMLWDGMPEPLISRRRQGNRSYRPPPPGTPVLVLGDLGCLDHSGEQSRRFWMELGRRLQQNDNRLLALLPCQAARWTENLSEYWSLLAWERPISAGSAAPASSQDLFRQAEKLLRLVAPAIRIEPGFLRSVRLQLGDDRNDAAMESDVWQHPAITSTSSVAASLDTAEAARLRREFEKEPEHLRCEVLALLRQWRAGLAQEIWFEEILSLAPSSQWLLGDNRDIEDAGLFIRQLDRQLSTVSHEQTEHVRIWFRRLSRRLPEAAWGQPKLGRALYRIWGVAHRDDLEASSPPGFDPRDFTALGESEWTWQILQCGGEYGLQFRVSGGESSAIASGSPVGAVRTRNGLIQVSVLRAPSFWRKGGAPPWAVDWGVDEFGSWATFEYQGVLQRLRWISPGSFLMGSPQDEPGRWDDEGPRHEVRLSRGYWLFDTPCTQALWEAVMGSNPSLFRSPMRPVESVSWEDCQKFLEAINGRIDGLELVLPSEAQWEYACRAGSAEATYAGNLEILGERNAPLLNGIAWYGGNSGVDFELAEGEDSSSWPEKQYEHERAGTHPVGLKAPNAWGLYDMLGNVWEWCLDGRRQYSSDSVVDPVGPLQEGVARVLRGGGWSSDARSVRAAYRYAYPPGYRDGSFGLRCARVQAGAEPVVSGPGRKAERRPAREQTGGAQLLRLGNTREKRCRLPESAAFAITSDCDRLVLRQITRPSWAKAIGRDAYGLWVDVEVEVSDGSAIAQRMRWIAPGRFQMGSAADEPGRREIEGPRHEVRLSRGYWLFDTPCTQALWEAVMGRNPSRFRSPKRPVENVNWEDCQQFLEAINGRLDGLELVLPSEAQWEYACRAESTAATYAGDLEILGESNAPLLDGIAWYGGNSGVDFELAEGADSSGWSEKQYEHERAGTHPVGLKAPNAWGLYDMLGNVWEWCSDGQRQYSSDSVVDPVGPLQEGVDRVLRGGSWYSDARHVRAAYRFAVHPGYRNDYIGLRCARVQE
jgi:formylglycine-generating enzyme required for sulfatase activity